MNIVAKLATCRVQNKECKGYRQIPECLDIYKNFLPYTIWMVKLLWFGKIRILWVYIFMAYVL